MFLSYADEDSESAEEIGELLTSLDVSFFLDNRSIDPGAPILPEIVNALYIYCCYCNFFMRDFCGIQLCIVLH